MTPTPPDPWRDVQAAKLLAADLAALAPLRHHTGVLVFLSGEDVWVRWAAGRADVVRYLLPVPGVVFFTHTSGAWVPFGRLVPTHDAPPEGAGAPIATVLSPAKFQTLPPEPTLRTRLVLTVVRGGSPQPVTALACSVGALKQWADTATTAAFAAVRAAQSGDRAVLLGDRLPAVPHAVRYWGDRVFVPIGYQPDPNLPADALRATVGAAADELLLLDETGAELIPRAAFAPLTRAGIRLGAMLQ